MGFKFDNQNMKYIAVFNKKRFVPGKKSLLSKSEKVEQYLGRKT